MDIDPHPPARTAAGSTDFTENSSIIKDFKVPTASFNNDMQVTNILFSTNSTETSASSATENTINTGPSYTNTSVIASTSDLVLQETKDPHISHKSDGIFKLPNTPKPRKRQFSSSGEKLSCLKTMSADWKIADTSDETVVESETIMPNRVTIYTKDSDPQWYDVHENIQNISKTIVPSRLPEAFNLPTFGQPKSKYDLESFYEHKSKEFFESEGEDVHDNAERSVSACISKISSTLVPVHISIPLAGIINEMMVVKPRHEVSPEDDLTINNMFRFRKEKDVSNIFTKKLKYRGIRLMPLLKEDEKIEGIILNPGKDIMFRVRIYRPFLYSKEKGQYRGRHSVFSRDLILIGCHKLTELRDSFMCANDVDMRLDMSERINETQLTTAKDLFPSGFLFVNNVFYVDKRKGCTDISERIREWALARGIGKFPCKDMSSVTIDQLNLKLGHPEVYVHQGNCEHLFTFSEMRLVTAGDPLNLSHYPCHFAISQNQTVYCTACAEFGAKFVVTGCDRVPFDPAFFCDTCLKLYLYKDGTSNIQSANIDLVNTTNGSTCLLLINDLVYDDTEKRNNQSVETVNTIETSINQLAKITLDDSIIETNNTKPMEVTAWFGNITDADIIVSAKINNLVDNPTETSTTKMLLNQTQTVNLNARNSTKVENQLPWRCSTPTSSEWEGLMLISPEVEEKRPKSKQENQSYQKALAGSSNNETIFEKYLPVGCLNQTSNSKSKTTRTCVQSEDQSYPTFLAGHSQSTGNFTSLTSDLTIRKNRASQNTSSTLKFESSEDSAQVGHTQDSLKVYSKLKIGETVNPKSEDNSNVSEPKDEQPPIVQTTRSSQKIFTKLDSVGSTTPNERPASNCQTLTSEIATRRETRSRGAWLARRSKQLPFDCEVGSKKSSNADSTKSIRQALYRKDEAEIANVDIPINTKKK